MMHNSKIEATETIVAKSSAYKIVPDSMLHRNKKIGGGLNFIKRGVINYAKRILLEICL